MRILVTGYKGFIGSHMANAFPDDDVTLFEWGDDYPAIKNFDWVIHLGAISATTERDVEKIMNQNLDFSIRLLNSCQWFGVNFQFASSASIYGLGTNFRENAPPDPRTPYAWSKYLFERYVRSQSPIEDICVQMFRYFNVYGSGEDHKGTQASPYHQFGKQARENGVIKVFENSENYSRDFVPVEQVVDTHKKFMQTKVSGVFNVGTGVASSFMDVAKSFDVPIETIPMPEILKSSYQVYTCADMSKTNRILQNFNGEKTV
jgi:ADP-L-glycero-D-manno-heptose 6-epimerase